MNGTHDPCPPPLITPHPDPIQRDLRTYTWMALFSLVGLITMALMLGLYLKQERKAMVHPHLHAGCYKWSDGTVSCARNWRSLTDDMVYGCTVANADPATGECK